MFSLLVWVSTVFFAMVMAWNWVSQPAWVAKLAQVIQDKAISFSEKWAWFAGR